MLADALGRPLRLIITPGQTGDITQAPALLEGQTGAAVLADKAYDSNAFHEIIAHRGAASSTALTACCNSWKASCPKSNGSMTARSAHGCTGARGVEH
jgi:transposase